MSGSKFHICKMSHSKFARAFVPLLALCGLSLCSRVLSKQRGARTTGGRPRLSVRHLARGRRNLASQVTYSM
jgi:hypothetical protein